MVYRGPSRGCKTCRTRRVKCDEGRPACKNCLRRGTLCPGYPQVFRPGERIIDETETISQQFESNSAVADEVKFEDSLAPSKVFGKDELFESICFFFNSYVYVDKGIQSQRGKLRYLPDFYATRNPDSAISLSITSLTQSFFSLWRGLGADSTPSRLSLNKALLALRSELEDPYASQSDDTLFAIELLKFRDHIVGLTSGKERSEHVHGAYAVIKHRGKQSMRSTLSKQIVQSLRNSAIFDALRNKTRIDLNVSIWTITEDLPFDPADDLGWLAIDVAELQAEYEEFKKDTKIVRDADDDTRNGHIQTLKTYIEKANKADQELVLWAECQRKAWKPIVLDPADVSASIKRAGMYRNLCHVYASCGVASIWHLQRLARMILLKITIPCEQTIQSLRAMSSSFEADLVSTMSVAHEKQRFQQFADDLCAAVPFHLGNRTEEGFINDFDDPNIEFPWPPPERDPWLRPKSDYDFGPEQDQPMSLNEHKREAVAVGGWHMIGPLWYTLQMLGEPMDLCADGSSVEKLGSLLREGQLMWIGGQLRRTLVLHRMLPKNAMTAKPPTAT